MSSEAEATGARAPKLVSNALVARMKPGSVLVDIANMPGSVPNTSTTAPTNVAFGSHAQTATTPVDSTGSVTVTCVSSTTPYNVLLGAGANYSSARRMASGTNYVPYELYRDSGRTQVWGETIGTDTQTGTGTSTFTVYGRVPNLAYAAGNYTDTVLVTVDY